MRPGLGKTVTHMRAIRCPLGRGEERGPIHVILGIEFDTKLMQMSLPGRKIAEIKSLLMAWRGKKAASKVEIQSLAGHLQHMPQKLSGLVDALSGTYTNCQR